MTRNQNAAKLARLLGGLAVVVCGSLARPRPAAADVGDGDVDAVEAYRLQDVKSTWTGMGLPADTLANGALFAQTVTYAGADPGVARINTANGQIRYEESTGGGHTKAEEVNVIALVGELAALGIDGEVGTFTRDMAAQDFDYYVSFPQGPYTNPVVFAQVTTRNDASPVVVYPHLYAGGGIARFRLKEHTNADGVHAAETVHWAVIEAGTYDLPDGRRLVVGTQSVTTTGQNDFDTIDLKGHFIGDAAVVATPMMGQNLNSYTGVRLEKRLGLDDTLLAVDVRFMGDSTTEGTTRSGEVGYMALGNAWEMASGRISLSAADGTSVGVQWSDHSNGQCYNLADNDFEDLATSLTFQTATAGRVQVVLYADAFCSGDAVGVSASANTTKTYTVPGSMAGRVSSFRVMWNTAQSIATPGCYAPGELLLANALGWLTLKASGKLVLYRYMPADGALSEIWSAGPNGNASKVCFTEGGALKVYHWQFDLWTGLNEAVVWSSGTDNQGTTQLTLTNKCDLAIRTSDNTSLWTADSPGCWQDLPATGVKAMPTFSLAYADLDGDDDEELLLVAANADGSGTLMIDPLGIIDFTTNTLDWGLSDDVWTALSSTQQAVLVDQMAAFGSYGTTIEGAELEAVLLSGAFTAETRNYYSFRFTGSGSAASASASAGAFGASLSVGDATFMMETGDFGVGFDVSATAATVTASAGSFSVEAQVLSAGATFYVERNAFAIGGGADLVAGAFTVGDENGSYAGVSAGIGVGAYAAASFGKNDQYGFTLDLPVIPVGVAVYVTGEDVLSVFVPAGQLVLDATLATADLAADLWARTGDLAGDATTLLASIQNTAEDVTLTYLQSEAGHFVVAAIAGVSIYTSLAGDIEDLFDAVVQDLADFTIEGLADTLSDLGGAITATGEDIEQFAASALNTVAKEVCGGIFSFVCK
ncbi:MAG: hypothetical protein H6706_20105 [Myxococcales bacterium]|nr:hypothetical protein [Myxococcales bacterium]